MKKEWKKIRGKEKIKKENEKDQKIEEKKHIF